MAFLATLKDWGLLLLAGLATVFAAVSYGRAKGNEADAAKQESRQLELDLQRQQDEHKIVLDTVQQRQQVELKAKGETDAEADARFDRWAQ